MDVCRSLGSVFDEPPAEKPTLMESLSAWNQIMPKEPVDPSAFTELFGEFHHQETSGRKASLESLLGRLPQGHHGRETRCSHGFLGRNSDPLQLCTEGLGSESSDDVDDPTEGDSSWSSGSCHDEWKDKQEEEDIEKESPLHGADQEPERFPDVRPKTGGCGRRFPPPISSIGSSGKPWICFRSYKQDGRFILRELTIPTKEFLHASREDGRLQLHLIQPHDDIAEEEEEDDDDEEQEEEIEIK